MPRHGKAYLGTLKPKKSPFAAYWVGKWPKLEGADEWTAKARKCEYDLWMKRGKK